MAMRPMKLDRSRSLIAHYRWVVGVDDGGTIPFMRM
jgi:hypothetical protein